MQKILIGISSLLACTGIMLFGHGLLGTVLSLRGIEEGYSESTIGIIMSMYFLGFISGTFLCPKLIRRVGHIRTLAALATICASISLLQGFFINIPAWAIMRFVSGICIVGMFMVIESWMNSQASNENRGRVFAIYVLINLCFQAVGQFMILAGDIHTLELFAISSICFSMSVVPVALTKLPQPTAVPEIRVGLRDLYSTSPLAFMGCFISGLIGSVFWALGPLFAYRSGFTEFDIAMFINATVLGGIVLQLPIGLLSDKHDRRIAIILVSFISAAATLSALFAPPGATPYLMVCMFAFGGMLFSFYPLSIAHANDHPGVNHVAVSTNLLLTYGIGAAIGPILGGVLMNQFGHNIMMAYFAVMSSLLGLFALYRRQHGVTIPVAQQTTFVPLSRTSQVLAEGIYQDKN